jgi:hypothetical protein
MKKLATLLVLTTTLLLISCTENKDDKKVLKGLVNFATKPYYEAGKIIFVAQIQYGFAGEGIDMEYKVLQGETVLLTKTLAVKNNADGGMNIFFKSDEIHIQLNPLEDFKGKEITIHLDPDNEHTSSDTAEHWKKSSVLVPQN